MNIIDLYDWNITHSELAKWAIDNNVDVFAIISHGANIPSAKYMFNKDADFVAFKLTFNERKSRDVGYYYAPHIPILK